MMIANVTAQAGRHKRRKRVGRGEASGHGKTCCRGNKGMQSRSGPGPHPLHEGGQTPVYRRLAKRGFSNFNFRCEYAPVNLAELAACYQAGESVTPQSLAERGLLRDPRDRVKILGKEGLTHKLSVSAHAFSAGARVAIEKAGGTVQVIVQRDPAALAKAKRRQASKTPSAPRPSRIEKKKAARQAAGRA